MATKKEDETTEEEEIEGFALKDIDDAMNEAIEHSQHLITQRLAGLHIMSGICYNLYQVRGGDKKSGSVYSLSMTCMESMLLDYAESLGKPENSPETP